MLSSALFMSLFSMTLPGNTFNTVLKADLTKVTKSEYNAYARTSSKIDILFKITHPYQGSGVSNVLNWFGLARLHKTEKENQTVTTKTETTTKTLTLKTKTVKILSQDCLETRQCHCL